MKRLTERERTEGAWPHVVAAGLAVEGDDAARRRLGEVVRILGARLSHLGEVPERCAYYFTDDYPVDAEGAEVLTDQALELLKALADRYEKAPEWTAAAAEEGMRAYAEELGLKLGALVHPARFAVSGQKVGPSLFDAMEVLGRETVVRRLRHPRKAVID